MILGFTGTRHGMTERQRFAVSEFLFEQRPTETHSGDCKGADSEFLDAALICNGNFPPRTHGHPCNIVKWRAHRRYDTIHPVKPPLIRNQDIVDVSEHLLAAPKQTVESEGGTWDTIRKGASAGIPVTVVWPDGKTEPWYYKQIRELKFRAYDRAKRQWIDGGYDFHIIGEAILHGGLFDNYRLLALNNVAITQFTGLQDKNGKDIYEGDILRHHKYGGDHEVIWIKESTGFFVGKLSWPLTELCTPNIEVVGNIFAPRKDAA